MVRVNESYVKQLSENRYLGLPDDYRVDDTQNRLLTCLPDEEFPIDLVWFLSQPENFGLTAKVLFNIELAPFQVFILQDLWQRKFPMLIGCRGMGKSFILGLYACLRAVLTPNCRIVLVGAAFRQSKLLFEYMEAIWRNAPIFQHIVGGGNGAGPKRATDRCTFYIRDSQVIAIPIGSGEKIRGLRANYTIADEFSSISPEIFEVVIRGFGAVSASPVQRAMNVERVKVLRDLGHDDEADQQESGLGFGNQTVISGTAYYSFNHFYRYWKRYTEIIQSEGDETKLMDVFGGPVPEDFDWRQYSVIRVPYTHLPPGFMDETQIAQAKATVHKSIFGMEYSACWANDSDGFFKRSLIESCVTTNAIALPSGPIQFPVTLHGDPKKKYVFGIDPASEADNFAIVVLEIHPDHKRIVYTWTINRKELRKRATNNQRSFYSYCARKIRQLMTVFPTEHIGIDAQGGGIHIAEALADVKELEPREHRLLPFIGQGKDSCFWWESKDKDTDGEQGDHVIHLVNFADARWTSEANHGLRKDFENKSTLFPYFDAVAIVNANAQDAINGREYDTLEDAMMEIEELKNELATIVHDQSPSGRDRWNTPETKQAGQRKGRLRKDRYSALIIANMIARSMSQERHTVGHVFVGGSTAMPIRAEGKQMYYGRGVEKHGWNPQPRTYGRGVYGRRI